MTNFFPNKTVLHRAWHTTQSCRKPHLSLYRRSDIYNVVIFPPDLHWNIMLLLFSISSWKWQIIIT